MPGSSIGPVPIVRLFGITEFGNSIQCNIHGFSPYFYIPAPNNFTQNHCQIFRDALNVNFNFFN